MHCLPRKALISEKIDAAFEICYGEEDEQAAAAALLRKKRFDPDTADETEIRKICGYLARKGFRYETSVK